MPDQLTEPDDTTNGRVGLGPGLRQVAIVVAVFAVGGVVAGVLWEWVWTPPVGMAVEGEWLLDPEGLRGEFSGTALYVVVASVFGLLLGALCGLFFDRRELLTLLAVAGGSVLAAWLMLRVGESLGPPDPRPLAEDAVDLTAFPSELEVAGRSPLVAFPSGALVGLIVVLFGLTRRAR